MEVVCDPERIENRWVKCSSNRDHRGARVEFKRGHRNGVADTFGLSDVGP